LPRNRGAAGWPLGERSMHVHVFRKLQATSL
jgi:hypothetical protein